MCPQAALFDRIFRAPEELLAVLAPHGWEQSPLFRVLHPTPQQRRDESRALRQRLTALCGKEPERPEPDDDEFADDASPIDPHREVVELIGRVVWDVFSWEAVALASTPVDRALARMAAEGAMRIGEPHANPYPESPLKSPAGTARRILDDLREDRL